MTGFPAVLVTGPRQSGKTTILKHCLGKQADYVSFDDPLEREFALEDPSGFLSRFTDRPVVLDEIQYVPDLLPHLKMRIDAVPNRLGHWLLTGSQQFGLMRDVSESLAGRVAVLELPPFGSLEWQPRELAQAIWLGGYPIPALHPDRRELWMTSYLRTYLERDVRQVKNITDLGAFQHFLALCAARHGQEFHKADLARECGISQPTITAWVGVLEASFVAFRVRPFFQNLGKRLVKTPKLYFLDSGLCCTLTRQPSAEASLAGAMGGALFEGWIVSEVWKLLAGLGQRPELYFWRSHDGLEVDLIVSLGEELLPIEIKLTASPTSKHVKPLNRFKSLAKLGPDVQGLLVCQIEQPRPLPGGNLALPWSEFLPWLKERLESRHQTS